MACDQAQLDANNRVVANSKGMLAKVNGTERVLSVGTGHTTAFCRAANAGCTTPISFLKDALGAIDIAKLKRQPDYKVMLETGWVWIVLPPPVEVAWPSAPDVLQRALNSSHEVHSSATELEVAVTIAECMESGDSAIDALNTALSGNPPCATYAQHLCTLAQYFGGGAKAPLLHGLAQFAQTHGENRRLSEKLLGAIVSLKFPEDAIYPRMIDALLATNLISEKVVDGVARTLTKTDVAGLSSKNKLPYVKEAEAHLDEASRISCALRATQAEQSKVDDAEGLFKVRVGAHLCNKGKQTFDGKAHKDLAAIVRLFLEDVHALLQSTPTSPVFGTVHELSASWVLILKTTPADEPKPEEPVSKGAVLLSVADLHDKISAAERKGFAVGIKVIEKGMGVKHGVYTIDSLGEQVVLVEHDIFKVGHLKVTLKLEQFILKWSQYKGDVPVVIAGDWSKWCSCDKKTLAIEAEKCKFLAAMLAHAKEHPVTYNDVLLCLKPGTLRANRDLAKGELVLTPCSTFSSIIVADKSTSFDLGFSQTLGKSVRFFATRPVQPRGESTDTWEDADSINPFWWATATAVESDVNVAVKSVVADGVSFNVLVNTRAIKKMCVIHSYKPGSAPQQPLAGASQVQGKRVTNAVAPPSKRGRGA